MGARIADLFALRADGTEFPAGIRLAPFRIGGKLFVAAAIRDITERRTINEELVAAREEAERANRAKSRFLATASHDLRQPMQTIRPAQCRDDEVRPAAADVRELLQQQGAAIESMTRLLNALLDISRLESGAIEPVSVEVAVGDVFEELRSEFASVAQRPRNRAAGRAAARRRCRPIARCSTSCCRTCWAMRSNTLTMAGCASSARTDADARHHCCRGFRHRHSCRQARAHLRRVLPGRHAWHEAHGRRAGPGDRQGSRAPAGFLGEDPVQRRRRHASRRADSAASYRVAAGAAIVEPAADTAPAAGGAQGAIDPGRGQRWRSSRNGTVPELEGHETLSARTLAEAEALLERLRAGDVVIADYHLDGKNTGLDLLMRLRERVGYDVPGVVLSGDLPSVLRSIKSPVPRAAS